RAGDHFDEVIEQALNEAKCIIVMWSERSVQSRYVRDEATYALEHSKLVPVMIENVSVPFRFRGVHTLRLIEWDGSKDSKEFRRLIDDISSILGRAIDSQKRQSGRGLDAGRKLDRQLTEIARGLIEATINDPSHQQEFSLRVQAALNRLAIQGL